MKKFLSCFASTITGILMGYLINQLPGVPEQLKPWVMPSTVTLAIVSSLLLSLQVDGSSETGMRGITINGNRNKVRAGKHLIENARITGTENDLRTEDDRASGGQNR
jgi:putative effector of murein hydrolase